ncbi:MAG: PqqD family protein [Alicyclobacillus herbarius]|uniref:PqqD family protein n=1 Tax=Alicyclobacillus herbarius TaxID=122960 RepID=UPI002356F40E|nr:PqqD family protein [Alicyclobacillus herbarius]MCL6633939.1 PqqD family protein [Alicyclobacillus herbarius]
MILYCRSRDVEAVEMDGEWLILHTRHFTVTRLNEAGGWIWDQLRQPRSALDLAADLATVYEVSTTQALSDVGAFLAQLQAAELIEAVG